MPIGPRGGNWNDLPLTISKTHDRVMTQGWKQVDRDALMQLIFPEGSSDFLQLSWVVLLFGAVLFAVLFEISVLAVKIFNPDDDTPAGPGGRSMASMASIDLPDEEVRLQPLFHSCSKDTCGAGCDEKGLCCL